ncbi:hypothetical protein CLIB1444_08S04984 [[Candida] jaroonii]|uniref:Uncharacterized protein n=1 Tax=[Candida] jaroonii TaxID=467808 RepID=A0ACA9YBW7_9ASCO|nr:hypothetical protein CLIB1444_08S04984 [[Candida] jaroonii]
MDQNNTLINKKAPVSVNITEYESCSQEGEVAKFTFVDWIKKPTVSKIAVSAGLYTFSTLSAPVVIELYFARACDSVRKADGTCSAVESQILVSNFSQANLVLSQVLIVLAISQLGRLSDYIGMKNCMLLMTTSDLLGGILTFLTLVGSKKFNFKSLLLFQSLCNLFGGVPGITAIASAYTAEITSSQNKAAALSLVGASLAIGQFLGTSFCTFILNLGDKLNFERESFNKIPFYVQYAVLSILLVFVIFLLPEPSKKIHLEDSIEVESVEVTGWRKYNPLRLINVLEPIKLLALPEDVVPEERKGEISKMRFSVISLVLSSTASQSVSACISTVLIQYCVYLLDWKSKEISTAILMVSGSTIFILTIFFPFFNKYFLLKYLGLNFNEHHFDTIDFIPLILAASCDLIFSFLVIFITSTPAMMGLLVLLGFDAIISPTVTSAITKYYPEHLTSKVVIALNLVGALIRVVGPLVLLSIYKFGLKHNFATLAFYFQNVFLSVVFVFLIVDKIISKSR